MIELAGQEAVADPITGLLRDGAKRLIRQAVETELQELLSAHGDRVSDDGKAGVVRNSYLPERENQTDLGPVTVRIPKVRARTGERVSFRTGKGTKALLSHK